MSVDLRSVSTKPFFVFWRSNGRLTYVRKIGLVDTGFLLTDQQIGLVSSRPTDDWLWLTTPIRKDGQGTNRLSGHRPLLWLLTAQVLPFSPVQQDECYGTHCHRLRIPGLLLITWQLCSRQVNMGGIQAGIQAKLQTGRPQKVLQVEFPVSTEPRCS